MALEAFRNRLTEVESAHEREEALIEVKSAISVTSDDLGRLSDLLQKEKLKYLVLRNGVLRTGVKALLPGLNSTHLLKLDLTNNSIGDVGVVHVCKALTYNQSLEELVLQQTGFGREGAQELGDLLRQNKNITSLDISQNPVGHKGIKHICDGILEKNSFGEHSKLVKLDLYRCDIGCTDSDDESLVEEECKDIAHVINKCGTLKELILANNGIGVMGANHVANGLMRSDSSHVSLEILDLSDNPLTDAGINYFAMRLVANDTLRDLSLRRVDMEAKGFASLCDHVRQSDVLKRLSIGGNNIPSDDVADPIIHMLYGDSNVKGVTNLKALDISDTSMTGEEVEKIGKKIAEQFPCGLEELNMAKCGVDDAGAHFIAEGLRYNMSLRILDLTGNPFGPEGAKSFAIMFRRHKELEEFRVTGSRIEAVGQNHLAQSLRYNKKLVVKGSSTELDYMKSFTHDKGAFVYNDDGEMIDWSHDAWSVVKMGMGAIIGTTLYLLNEESKDEMERFKKVVLNKRNKVGQTMFECLIRHSEPSIIETMRFFTSKCGVHLDDAANSLSGESYELDEGKYRIIAQREAKDPAVKDWAKNKDLVLDRYQKVGSLDSHASDDYRRFNAIDKLNREDEQKVFVQEYSKEDDFERELESRAHFHEMMKAGGPFALNDSILRVVEEHDEASTISFSRNIGSLASTMDSLGACAGYDMAETCSLAKSCAELLGLINSFGRVHGDFRPKNLMLVARARDDEVNGKIVHRPNKWVLFDFSKSVPHGERVALREDSAYMPPEVARAALIAKKGEKSKKQVILPKATEAMDVWSFGVVLYQLLTGMHLFHTDVPNDMLFKLDERAELMNWLCLDGTREKLILHRANEGLFYDKKSYKQLLDNAKDLVHWCLQEHPMNRPTFNEILKHPFLAYKRNVAYNAAELLMKWYEITGKKKSLHDSVQGRMHAHVVNSRERECIDVQKSLKKMFRKAGCRLSTDLNDSEKSITKQRDEVRKARCVLILLTRDSLFQTSVIKKLLWAEDCPETTQILFLDVSTAGTGAGKFKLDEFLSDWKNTSKGSKFDRLVDSLMPYNELVGTLEKKPTSDSKKALSRFLQTTVLEIIEGVYEKMMPFRATPFLAKAMVREIMERCEFVPIDRVAAFKTTKASKKLANVKDKVKVLILHNQDTIDPGAVVKSAMVSPALNLRKKMMGLHDETQVVVYNKSMEDVPTVEDILEPHFTRDSNNDFVAESPVVILCLVTEGFLQLYRNVLVPISRAKGPVVTKLIAFNDYKPSSDELMNTGLDVKHLDALKSGKALYPLFAKNPKTASYEHQACLDNILDKSRLHLSQRLVEREFDNYEFATTIC